MQWVRMIAAALIAAVIPTLTGVFYFGRLAQQVETNTAAIDELRDADKELRDNSVRATVEMNSKQIEDVATRLGVMEIKVSAIPYIERDVTEVRADTKELLRLARGQRDETP